MTRDLEVLPRWLQEFKRFQTLKSQFYLYGNVYDSFYFPINWNLPEETESLQWARFNDICKLLTFYLKSQGYEIITYYDLVDGLSVESADPSINRSNIIDHLSKDNPNNKIRLASNNPDLIDRNLGEALNFFSSLSFQ